MLSARSPSREPGTGERPRAQGGYTLNEALIMLVIVGLVMVIALPNWMRARTKARANNAVRAVENVFNFARTEALKRHSPVVLTVDASNRRFVTFEDWDPNNNPAATGTNGNGIRDGAELVIQEMELDTAMGFASDPEGGSPLSAVSYASDGSNRGNTGGNALFLADIKNNVFRIEVNPVTGSSRVEKWIASTSSWSPRRENWEWSY